MKKEFLQKLIITTMISTTVTAVSTEKSAHADWSKNSKNQWSWTENNVKATGWKLINNKWYHFSNDGIMTTGWFKDKNSKWYYLMPSGEMKTGWLFDGKWYHLGQSGAMTTGWFKDSNSKWYYLMSNGEMKTGWLKEGSKWYYLMSSGEMKSGWLTLGDKKYYFNSDGSMVTGKITIDKVNYSFAESGELISSHIENEVVNDKETVEEFKEKTAYVITESSSLNLRDGASASSNIIGYIPRGSEVKIIGNEVNGFLPIIYGDKKGWASSSWLGPVKPDPIGNASNDSSNNSSNTSNSNNNTNKPSNSTSAVVDLSNKPIRTTAPDNKNLYYYSDGNIFYKARYSPPFYRNGKQIIGNCTWYAWGRAWELTGQAPIDAGLTGNAYQWWNANKASGKYKYGSTPKKGAIAVWKSSMNSSGLGHVAIVEKIENGKIYISESAWQGVLFKYREMYQAEHLYGYIYIDEPNY